MMIPSLPLHEPAGPGERVLVVAPHPDDETLALGGLIYESVRRGADVRIVFLTSGDGFALCAADRYRAWPGSAVMRRLGAERREEAARATARLGVAEDRLTFLGYPDRGLAALWLDRWSRPFRSPYTGLEARGADLLVHLECLLRDHRPERVYYPDSLDDHPDHWSAHCFVRAALERTERAAVERTYLIHRGRWPRRGVRLVPPCEAKAYGARWESLPLDDAAIRIKREALDAHTTQAPLVGGFLRQFVRQNELLAAWPDRPSHYPDATADRAARILLPGGDFSGLELKERRLTARLRRRPLPGVRYFVCWKPLVGPVNGLQTRRERGLIAVVDLNGPVLAAAFCWAGPILLDRTPWYRLQIEA